MILTNLESGDFNKIHELHYKDCHLLVKWVDRMAWHFGKSRSGLIFYIIDNCLPLLEKYHFKRQEQGGVYKTIEEYRYPKKDYLNRDEPGEKKVVSVHCYMPEVLYRKLKQVKGDLNFYSIAQVVRELVRFFLWLFDRYGVGCLEILSRVRENRKKRYNRCRKEKIAIRQLSGNTNEKVEMNIVYTRDKQIQAIYLQ